MKTSKNCNETQGKHLRQSRTLRRLCLVLTMFWLIGLGCSDLIDEDAITPQDIDAENTTAEFEYEMWVETFQKLWNDQAILVPLGGSIQDAVDLAKPGDVLLIEGGKYWEEVFVEGKDIQLVGIPGNSGQTVELSGGDVEIINAEDHLKVQNRSFRYWKGTREKLANGIVHFEYNLRVGHGTEEMITLHRVVKERRPGWPVRTEGAVFMVHGSSQDFEDIFLTPGVDVGTPQNSCPVFLANHNIDVWGIDLAWTKIPATTSDFSFMEDWGVERDVRHTRWSLRVARLIRLLSGQGLDRLNLLGFSYGSFVAYAAAGQETQVPRLRKDIKGIIPVDFGSKFAAEEVDIRAAACNRAAGILNQLQQGIYQNNSGQGFSAFGMLALTAPDSLSPFIPNLTNYEAVLFLGTNTFLQPNSNSEFWHFIAGDISTPLDFSTTLRYTSPDRWLQLAAGLPPYMPARAVYEVNASICAMEEVTIDDYLDQISLPILYLGAAGGTGEPGGYTTGLTASQDITHHTVMLESADAKFRDFGHADLFMGDNAADLVWDRLRVWLIAH